MVSVQIPLKMNLKEEVSFDTFVTEKPATAILLNQFQNSLKRGSGAGFYLQGDSSVGKTHLLQSACRYKASLKQSAVYLPLKDQSLPFIADSLNGLEQIPLVCIDDIDIKMQQIEWQKSLASLLIKAQTAGSVIALTGKTPYLDWDIKCADLSRALMNVLTITLTPLSKKKDLVDALQRHAKKRGFNLPPQVGQYLVKQFSNQLEELLAVLHLLEQATLAEKKRLSLPFVTEFLKKKS